MQFIVDILTVCLVFIGVMVLAALVFFLVKRWHKISVVSYQTEHLAYLIEEMERNPKIKYDYILRL